MRTTLRSTCVAVLALLISWTVAPAAAKGPTIVEVSGPGVTADVGPARMGAGIDVGSISDAARLADYLGARADRLAPSPGVPPSALGSRYVLTWKVAGWARLVLHAYPFAEGGARARFLPGDTGGDGVTGWARTPALRRQLIALGAITEPHPEKPAEAPVKAATDGGAAESGGAETTAYDVVMPAGLAIAVVLAAGALMVRRRVSREAGTPPHPAG